MCNCSGGPSQGQFADIFLLEEEKFAVAKCIEKRAKFPIDYKYITCTSTISEDFKKANIFIKDNDSQVAHFELTSLDDLIAYVSLVWIDYRHFYGSKDITGITAVINSIICRIVSYRRFSLLMRRTMIDYKYDWKHLVPISNEVNIGDLYYIHVKQMEYKPACTCCGVYFDEQS